MSLEVHDIAPAKPGQIAIVLLVFLILNLQKSLLSFLELFGRS